jgi:hypothetical protein
LVEDDEKFGREAWKSTGSVLTECMAIYIHQISCVINLTYPKGGESMIRAEFDVLLLAPPGGLQMMKCRGGIFPCRWRGYVFPGNDSPGENNY